MVWPAIIAAVGSIAGGLLGAGAARSGDKSAAAQAALDRQFQQDMARNQIQWRVEDAKKAGIHPLYALGPTGMQYSPPAIVGGGSEAPYLAQMGQDVGRAISAGMSERERDRAAAAAVAAQAMERQRQDVLYKQQVEHNELNNVLLAERIAQMRSPGTPPGMPEVRNVGTGTVSVLPSRTTSPSPATLGREAGSIRDYGFANNDDGGLVVVPSWDIHERIEDNFLQQWSWAIRNQVAPLLSGVTRPSYDEFPLPAGQQWEWDFTRQAFYPQSIATGRWIR